MFRVDKRFKNFVVIIIKKVKFILKVQEWFQKLHGVVDFFYGSLFS